MHSFKRLFSIGAALAVSSAVLAACGSSATSASTSSTSASKSGSSQASSGSSSSGTLQTIRVGLTSKTATDWPLYVADKLGYFKQEGVKVDYVIVGSASGNAQQLAAGSNNIGETSSTQVIEAIQGGAPIKYVINQVITPPYTLLGQKNIKSIKDLKGKTVIIGGSNDITRVFFDAMLKGNGMTEKGISFTYAGSTANRFAALKSGSVAAAILFPPFDFTALSEGYSNLGSVQKYLPSFPFDGFAANSAWASSHKTVLVDFIKGYLKGVNWLYNSANETQAVSILQAETNSKAQAAKETYQELFMKLHAFSKTGEIGQSSMTTVEQAMLKLGLLKSPLPPVSKFYDNSYAAAAAK